MIRTIQQLSIGLGLVLAGIAVGHGITNLKRYDQAVSVRGLDERLVKSNEASWNLSFTVLGNSFEEVQGKVSATQGLFSISAPNSEYDSESTLMKKVRVVTQVNFFLD